eukprot:TRINITY_DN8272_c0_g1_i4.p1 TRINITY_DN8272_c0_g1~~TRINITY_DN8272_c0_g1_i4.p1  ORF type:complete len:197 (+),score=18.75 TRINITY_DN8272_c0_g1_i4:130-720(+)
MADAPRDCKVNPSRRRGTICASLSPLRSTLSPREEGFFSYIVHAETLRVVWVQQLPDQVLRTHVEELWHVNDSCDDFLVDSNRIRVVERRKPIEGQQFFNAAKNPASISKTRTPSAHQSTDLPSKVLWSSAERERAIVRQFLRKSEVSDLHMPSLVNQKVLRLQISVDNVLLVERPTSFAKRPSLRSLENSSPPPT